MNMSPEQAAAIAHGEGPLVINAGAGSGKTRVLVNRVARLLSEGETPESIVVATFTQAAAEEMKQRLIVLVGEDLVGRLAHIGTLHSLGYKFYRKQKGKRINAGKAGGSMLSPGAFTGMVKGILEESSRYCPFGMNLAAEYPSEDLSRKAGKIAKNIQRVMDTNLTPQQYYARAGQPDFDEVTARAYEITERLLSEGWYRGRKGWERHTGGKISVTFACMGIKGLAAARDEAVREAVIGSVKWVLVDEAQDCNAVQFGLMNLLARQTSNVTFVGDDDQSIYSFRGAMPAEFIAQATGEGVTVIALGTNYRSRRPIVDAAARLIAHNTERLGKTVDAHNDTTEEFTVSDLLARIGQAV
jgi:DNA helicase-2/ATP-dependent DNA helicase PcrA